MSITGLNAAYGNRIYEKTPDVKASEKPEEAGSVSLMEKAAEGGSVQSEDRIEISEEGRRAAGQEKETQETAGSEAVKEEKEGSSQECGGKVGVNEGKRARQIAAAKDQGQLQQVLALLRQDLADCKAGQEKGWCDESEVAKVEALMNQAKARMSQVSQESDDSQGGIDAFSMASLM